MTATVSRTTELSWDAYWQWAGEPELGGIYTDTVSFWTDDNYKFTVSFRVGEGRTLGLLFAEVVTINPQFEMSKMHYCLGQFYRNSGAKVFAQFALDHFMQTETWSACPSFHCVDYIDGDPFTLSGDELVSDID
jgi:hypothetical protein